MSFPLVLQSILFALIFSGTPALAGEADDDLVEARTNFLQGADGDKRAASESTRLFRALSMREPENPVYLAYFGASMTLQGRDTPNNVDKLRLTEAGLRNVDHAFDVLLGHGRRASAVYLETLLVITNTYIHIPAFFDRYNRGRALLQVILEHGDFEGMSRQFRAAAYFAAALVALGDQTHEQYRHFLKLSAETDPDGRNGRAAQELLQDEQPDVSSGHRSVPGDASERSSPKQPTGR